MSSPTADPILKAATPKMGISKLEINNKSNSTTKERISTNNPSNASITCFDGPPLPELGKW